MLNVRPDQPDVRMTDFMVPPMSINQSSQVEYMTNVFLWPNNKTGQYRYLSIMCMVLIFVAIKVYFDFYYISFKVQGYNTSGSRSKPFVLNIKVFIFSVKQTT